MQKDEMIFPRCGITYGDLDCVRGMSMAEAAVKIGIDIAHFSQRMKGLGLQHLFSGRNRYRHRTEVFPDLGITRAEVESCHGMLQKDAAAELGVSYGAFNARIRRDPELRALFPAKGGEARRIAEHGYAGVYPQRR